MCTKKQHIYLASQSPRRTALLTQMGIEFQRIDVNVSEIILKNESCDDYVSRLAEEKTKAGREKLGVGDFLIIGADTVIFHNAEIMGKPTDEQDATRMLTRLSNKTHQVKTAVSICNRDSFKTIIQTNLVTFAELTPAKIAEYWQSGEPNDKAGAYAVQGFAAMFIKRIEGSYSGIMGLPIYETARLLNDFGYIPKTIEI